MITFIPSYTFYIEYTIYRDNPPVSLTLTPFLTQGGLLSVLISNKNIRHNTHNKIHLQRDITVYRVIRWYTTEKGHGIQFCDKIKGIKIT